MSMPIYLMSIRVFLSVDFCVTLKPYLKRGAFYNASACGPVLKIHQLNSLSLRSLFGANFRIADGPLGGVRAYRTAARCPSRLLLSLWTPRGVVSQFAATQQRESRWKV